MHKNEWTLIFFTLIAQLAVGLTLMFAFVYWSFPGFNIVNVWFKSPEFIILLLMGIAALVSLLHLGKPLNAPHSMNNLSGSWISREILTLALFTFSVFVLFLVKCFFEGNQQLISLLYIFSSVCGIFFIYSMSRIYTITTIPPWNYWYTPVSFFLSVVLFGTLGFYVLKSYFLLMVSNQLLTAMLVLLVLVIAASAILHYHYLNSIKDLSVDFLDYSKGLYYRLFLLRIVLLVLLLLSFVFIYFQSVPLLFVVSLIIFQEFVGRFMFYKSFFRIGV